MLWDLRSGQKRIDYANKEDLEIDLSKVKTKEDEEKFKQKYLADCQYREVPDREIEAAVDKYEELEEKRQQDLMTVIVEDNIVKHAFHLSKRLSEEDKKTVHEYMLKLLEAGAEGKDVHKIPMSRFSLKDIRGRFDTVRACQKDLLQETSCLLEPKSKSLEEKNIEAKEAFKIILSRTPKTMFESIDEIEHQLMGHSLFQNSDDMAREQSGVVAEKFIEIKLRERLEKQLDQKLTQHFATLAKETRRKKQEEIKKIKQQQDKTKGLQDQEIAKKIKAAHKRLVEKNLISEDNSRKNHHWGDASVMEDKTPAIKEDKVLAQKSKQKPDSLNTKLKKIFSR